MLPGMFTPCQIFIATEHVFVPRPLALLHVWNHVIEEISNGEATKAKQYIKRAFSLRYLPIHPFYKQMISYKVHISIYYLVIHIFTAKDRFNMMQIYINPTKQNFSEFLKGITHFNAKKVRYHFDA